MDVKEIIREKLIALGADGLAYDGECGCPINDLMLCDDYSGDCVPAKLGPATKEMIEEYGDYVENEDFYYPLEDE